MKLTIKGNPIAKQSARFAKVGKFMKSYQPKEIVNAKADIRSQVLAQLPKDFVPIKTGLRIGYVFYFAPPKSLSVKKQKEIMFDGYIPKTTKPDIDNLIKHLNDALEGIVFVNDSQIYEYIKVLKLYSTTPQIQIIVE